MKICVDCADEIPAARLNLAPGTMRCVTCQELHEVDLQEKSLRQNKPWKTKQKNKIPSKAEAPKSDVPLFYKCFYCNYKKNQFTDRACAWCGKIGNIR